MDVVNEEHPIVATGIVGYWLHFRNCKNRLASLWAPEGPQIFLEQYITYTEDKLKQYKKTVQRDDPSSWRRDLEREFYTEVILPNEEKLNKQTEALFEYITPNDCNIIKAIMREYILFLKTKKQKFDGGELEQIKGKLIKLNIDENRLRKHFKPIFKGEIKNNPDKIPDLIGVIQTTTTDIGIGQIALQIFDSDYFFKDNYKRFMPWYRDFCGIIGAKHNPNYNQSKFKIKDKEQLASFAFLKKIQK